MQRLAEKVDEVARRDGYRLSHNLSDLERTACAFVAHSEALKKKREKRKKKSRKRTRWTRWRRSGFLFYYSSRRLLRFSLFCARRAVLDPGPQRSDRTVRHSAGDAPLLVVASLAGGDEVDATTVSFLLRENLMLQKIREEEEEKERMWREQRKVMKA